MKTSICSCRAKWKAPVVCVGSWLLSLLLTSLASAQVKVETIAEGLHNPCGIAIQPESGHIFVSDSGAGRVIRVVDGEVQDVITGFPQDLFGEDPTYRIGPLGLAFIRQGTLVVGGGGLPDGDELLRVYELPKAGAKSISADQTIYQHALRASTDRKAEGNFYGVTFLSNAIFVTCNGDDDRGWISQAEVAPESIGTLRRFMATKTKTQTVGAPAAITKSPLYDYLVVGQMGKIDDSKDGVLSFYHPASRRHLLSLPTNLYDMTGLAYSPKTQLLYATDFAWTKPNEGGLYRLDVKRDESGQTVVPTKIISLLRPTALAFAQDGTLFVTVVGEGSDEKSGKLLKIAPSL